MSPSNRDAGRVFVLLLALGLMLSAIVLSTSASIDRPRDYSARLDNRSQAAPLVPAAVDPPHYTIADLGELPGSVNNRAQGLNNFGAAVGIQYVIPSSETSQHAFRYRNGALIDLAPLYEAYAINNAGQTAGGRGTPAIYNSDGSVTPIPLLPGDAFGVAYAINDSGHAVGFSKPPIINDDTTNYSRAILYRDGATIDLNFGTYSTANGINNSDQVVGTLRDTQALLWSNGVVTDLGSFRTNGGGASALAINNVGQVTGFMLGQNPNGTIPIHAFLWTAGFKEDLGSLPNALFSRGYGINEYAQVVGESSVQEEQSRAFIHTNNENFDLNNLIPANSGWVLRTAYDINDTGQIVGTGQINNGTGPFHAFLLTPMTTAPFVAGGRIAFASSGEIWTMNDDGTKRLQLTNTGLINSSPSWSPDGSRIAFQQKSGVGTPGEIFVMSADGHDLTNLSNSSADDRDPVWSPDGKRIAFSSNRNGNYNIYAIRADGSNLVNLTNSTFFDVSPSWSPDGTKLVFESARVVESDIYVMNADGSNQLPLTADSDIDQHPAWSPDGKHIAFVSTRNGEGFQIWVMNADGSNPVQLTHNATQNKNLEPAWSPDGSRIVFISLADHFGGDVWTMKPDGSNRTRLTDDPITDNYPDWQKLEFPQPNVIDDPRVFVRQHYQDFLNRGPDNNGLTFWTAQVSQCLNNEACIRDRRIDVSAAFFISDEFQRTGFFIHRLYTAALGRRSSYAEFVVDRPKITVGSQLESSRQAFAEEFVNRTDFTGNYPLSLDAASFVDALIASVKQNSGVDFASRRNELIAEYNAGSNQTNSRARSLRKLTDYAEYVDAQYNPAFVLMQYFGYLERGPDPNGYNFWLDVLNTRVPNNYRGMVCAFITSAEYQHRFGSVATRSNAQCGS